MLGVLEADVSINGTPYKIGRHGLPFRWNGEQWIKSNKTKLEVVKAVNDSRKRSQRKIIGAA